MPLTIISADERLSEARNKTSIAVFGPESIGKTRLVLGLEEASTLFIEMEPGMKSIPSYRGGHIRPETWIELAEIACLMAGPDPTARPTDTMSREHYTEVINKYGKMIDLRPYRLLFMDSITVMSRWCAAWAKTQPESYSDRGTPNNYGYYGLIAKEMIRALTHFQRAPGLDVVFVGLLERVQDDIGRITYQMQLEGARTGRELPGIMDVIITMDRFLADHNTGIISHAPADPKGFVGFCCHKANPWGLPGKDRTGLLEIIEEPDLGKLFHKLNPQRRKDADVVPIAKTNP